MNSKSTASDSPLLHAATAKLSGLPFTEVLASSSKMSQSASAEEPQARAMSGDRMSKTHDDGSARRYENSPEQKASAEKSASTRSTTRTTLAQTQSAAKQRTQSAPEPKVVPTDHDAAEKASTARVASRSKQDQANADQGTAATLQNQATGLPTPTPVADPAAQLSAASEASDSSATGDTNAVTMNSARADASAKPDDAKAAGPQQSTQHVTTDAAEDMQATPLNALLAEMGMSDVDAGAEVGGQTTSLDEASSASPQAPATTNGADASGQGSGAQSSSAAAVKNVERTQAPGLGNLQATVGGEPVAATPQVPGSNSDNAHSDSTLNGSDDSKGQRVLANAVQAGTATVHTELVSALQTASVVQHTGPQPSVSTHSAATASSVPAQTANAVSESTHGETPGTAMAGMPGISAAHLVQTMSNSEMRVGIHSAEFGAISIRTAVTQQQMQAQIAVEHGELGSTLASHIPSLQQRLGSSLGLQASIEVNANGTGFSGNGQGTSQQQTATPLPMRAATEASGVQTDISIAAVALTASGSYRLDIRA